MVDFPRQVPLKRPPVTALLIPRRSSDACFATILLGPNKKRGLDLLIPFLEKDFAAPFAPPQTSHPRPVTNLQTAFDYPLCPEEGKQSPQVRSLLAWCCCEACLDQWQPR